MLYWQQNTPPYNYFFNQNTYFLIMRIKSFRNEKRKQYYFRVYNGKEEQVIKSEAYNSKASRDNGISSFKKNAHLEERYERLTAADGKFYFNMKAANGQVIATSLMFDSEAQRDATIQEIIDYASSAGKKESVSIEKTAASAPPPTTTSKAVDEYQSLDFYKTSGTDTQSGFDSFQKGDDGAYYFSFKSDDGKVLLLSQAYGAEAGRDNGINSVKKNALIEERYSTHFSDDGKYYFSLKAGNHQEIARSVYFDSEEEINRALTIVMKGGGAMEEPKMQKAAAMPNAPSGRTEDEYMDAAFYQESGTEVKSGFDRFQKGDDNAHYFSFKSDDGKVLLLSQAYTAEAGRDNGISSVEKNATVEKRYTTHTTDDGQFYFTLKAGNHQEIAKSVYFSSEDEMKRAMSIVMKGGGTMAEPKMEKAAAMPKAASGRTEDEYMDAAFYQDSGNDVKSDFDRFRKGDDNAYYFSYRGSDGNVLLKSQAYTAESGRDNGIKSVMKNSKIEKRYSEHKTDNGKYYFSLKAGNHQEIAQSVEFDSEAAMQAAMKTLMSSGEQKSSAQGIAAKATPPPAAATEEKKETAAKGNGMDDYRTFGFYKESETGVQNGWDKFYSEKHDEHYFSYKVDGEPVLISEGYSSAAARDNGIASVEKNWASAKRYKYHETKGGRFYYTITAGNHQEIARSKWYATAEERDGGTKWLMAGGLGVAAASGTAMKSSLKSEEAESLSAVSLSSSSEGGTIGKTTKDA